VLDPARQRLVLFGGFDGVNYLNDTWALTLSGTPTWSAIAPTGALPTGRSFHGATFDAAHDEMVVFAGSDGTYRNDAFVLSFSGSPSGRHSRRPSRSRPTLRALDDPRPPCATGTSWSQD
jgi:hypothetical protein